MTDEQLLQTLGSWLKDTDAAAPDARRLSDRVMARVPQTRQRGRWWPMPIFRRSTCVPPAVPSTEFELASFPSANDNPSTIIGRTYAMFGPIKAIIAGALVFALGGLFLVAQPSDQQVSVPGVPTDEGIGEATSFEGVMVYRGNPVHGVLEALPNGVITNRGFVATYYRCRDERPSPRRHRQQHVELGPDPHWRGT